MTHRLSPPQERILFSVFREQPVDTRDRRIFHVLIRSGYMRFSGGHWALTSKGRDYCKEYELEVEP